MPDNQTDTVRLTVDQDGETCLLIRTKDLPTVHPATVPHVHVNGPDGLMVLGVIPGDNPANLYNMATVYLALAAHLEQVQA